MIYNASYSLFFNQIMFIYMNATLIKDSLHFFEILGEMLKSKQCTKSNVLRLKDILIILPKTCFQSNIL